LECIRGGRADPAFVPKTPTSPNQRKKTLAEREREREREREIMMIKKSYQKDFCSGRDMN
jgi:hypothetical protein